jgi:branched-chain amino acid transport system substrate-binding protein
MNGRSLQSVLRIGVVTAVVLFAGRALAQAPAPIEMYAILPLTGNVAFLGQALEKSMQAIETSTNAGGGIAHRPIKFVFLDDGSSAVNALQLANGIPKTATFFFDAGPLAACRATAAIVKDNGPVEFCLTPVMQPARGSYIYTTSASLFDTFDASMRYMQAQGWNRVAVLDTTDATGQVIDGIIDDLMHQPRNATMKVVAMEHFGLSDLSAAGQISRILAAKPQAIILGSAGNATGTALRGLNDIGNTLPVISVDGNMTIAQMEAYKSFLPPTLLFGAPRWAGAEAVRPGPIKAALNAYYASLKAAGVRGDIGTSFGYDMPLLVVDVLRKLGPDASATRIRDYIDNSHDFAGINGFYDFRAAPGRGLTINDVIVVRWDSARDNWVAVSGPAGTPLLKH